MEYGAFLFHKLRRKKHRSWRKYNKRQYVEHWAIGVAP
jgi:hypothetical protein